MVQTNFFQKEINLKFIYYGKDNAGKKTILQNLHDKLDSKEKTPVKEEDFDGVVLNHFYHIPKKSLAGMKIKCGIYSVPEDGIMNKKTLSLLETVDGIIFVANLKDDIEDSCACFARLEDAFKKIDEKLQFRSIVMQYNKKDLLTDADVVIMKLNSALNKYKKNYFPICALEEKSILPTWEKVYSQVMIDVRGKLDSTTKNLPKSKLKFNFAKKKTSEVENEEEEKSPLIIPKKFAKKEEKIEEESLDKIFKEISTSETPTSTPIVKGNPLEDLDVFEETSQDDNISNIQTQEFVIDTDEMESISKLKATNDLLSELDASLKEERLPETNIFENIPPAEKRNMKDVYSETIHLQSSPINQLLETTSSDQALEKIKNGEILQNAKLQILDLRNYNFVDPVRISKCNIEVLLCDGSEFNNIFTIEDSKINQSFNLSSNLGSLFRDSIKLKRVEISGEIIWDGLVAAKEVTILDSNWNCNTQINKCTFEKEIFFANSNLQNLECLDSNFRGEFTITGCRFENTVEIKNCIIEEKIYISSSFFQKAYFKEIDCKGNIEIINTTFDKIGSFKKANISKGFCLEGCVFNGRSDFTEARIKGEWEIRRTEFFEDASFHKASGSLTQCFENVTFAGMTDFSKSLLKQVEFIQTLFKGITHFNEAIFSENASFLESTFETTVHFSRAIFYKKVDFTECAFNGNVSFRGMIGNYVILHRNQIEKKLLCDKSNNQEIIKQEYLTIKRTMDQQRRSQDKDWAHYHARKAERKSKKMPWFNPFKLFERACNWLFLDLGSRYGTKPQNTIILGFLLWICFGMIYSFVFPTDIPQNSTTIFQDVNLEQYLGQNSKQIFSGLEISLKAILPGTAIAQVTNSWMLSVIIIESTLGIILAFLFSILLVRKLLQS